jgi:hypothetical protein
MYINDSAMFAGDRLEFEDRASACELLRPLHKIPLIVGKLFITAIV